MNKPMLIAIGGKSGSGKTTLGMALSQKIPNSVHFDSDIVFKEIMGVNKYDKLPDKVYTWGNIRKMITEIDKRASKALSEGKNVIISAVFMTEESKQDKKLLAKKNNAEFKGLFLKADLKTLFNRVSARKNNPSDAGINIVKRQSKDPFISSGHWTVIDANEPLDAVVKMAIKNIEYSLKNKINYKNKNLGI